MIHDMVPFGKHVAAATHVDLTPLELLAPGGEAKPQETRSRGVGAVESVLATNALRWPDWSRVSAAGRAI